MNPVIRDKWAERLRRPDYVPYRKALHNGNGDMCPLGVLCDLHRLETGAGDWNQNYYVLVSGGGAAFSLPEEVCEWAGLPLMAYPQLGKYNVAEWNDGHSHGWNETFAPASPLEIAAKIEEYL